MEALKLEREERENRRQQAEMETALRQLKIKDDEAQLTEIVPRQYERAKLAQT